MSVNEAGWDRVVRVILGVILLALYFMGNVSGGVGIVVLIIGLIALLTGLFGFCPLYKVIGFSTKK